jgi:hypothetical protein
MGVVFLGELVCVVAKPLPSFVTENIELLIESRENSGFEISRVYEGYVLIIIFRMCTI